MSSDDTPNERRRSRSIVNDTGRYTPHAYDPPRGIGLRTIVSLANGAWMTARTLWGSYKT